MPFDSHKLCHSHGFWGRALSKIKSRSSEQLVPQQCRGLCPDKRAFSSRDLSSGTGPVFGGVLAELKHNQGVGSLKSCNQWASKPPVIVEEASCSKSKRHGFDIVKSALSRGQQKVMSVVTPPSRAGSPSVSTEHEVDVLERTLQNVRMKLVSAMSSVLCQLV